MNRRQLVRGAFAAAATAALPTQSRAHENPLMRYLVTRSTPYHAGAEPAEYDAVMRELRTTSEYIEAAEASCEYDFMGSAVRDGYNVLLFRKEQDTFNRYELHWVKSGRNHRTVPIAVERDAMEWMDELLYLVRKMDEAHDSPTMVSITFYGPQEQPNVMNILELTSFGG